jgi:hypothetical protein
MALAFAIGHDRAACLVLDAFFSTGGVFRLARRPTANRLLKAPSVQHLPTVEACWQAYEIFVLCAAIAHGLLQLLALRFGAEVWQRQSLYLRTQSRPLPSEKTVRQVLAPILIKQQLTSSRQTAS